MFTIYALFLKHHKVHNNIGPKFQENTNNSKTNLKYIYNNFKCLSDYKSTGNIKYTIPLSQKRNCLLDVVFNF